MHISSARKIIFCFFGLATKLWKKKKPFCTMCEVCAEHYFLLLKVASQQMVAFALCWSISFHSSFVSFITLRCVNLYRKLIGLIHIFPKISSKNERSIFLGIIYVNSVVWRNRGKSRRLFGIAPSFFTRHRCLMTVA